MGFGAFTMVDPASRHRPVMVREVMDALDPQPGKLMLDGTLGMGGHTRAWLDMSAPSGRVIGIDRDRSAVLAASESLAPYASRLVCLHASYVDVAASDVEGAEGPFDAVLLDLGLGSHQLEDADRGFSFSHDGPLDMRFDRSGVGRTAADIVNETPEPELVTILKDYGEERAAKKIARAIVAARKDQRFRTTRELADVIRRAAPKGGGQQRIDPCTRTFQALRIATNCELEDLEPALLGLIEKLVPGGRIAVISFHSLEDRIVKRTLRRLAEPPQPRFGEPRAKTVELTLNMPVRRVGRPTEEEVETNRRARSARLRWGIKR